MKQDVQHEEKLLAKLADFVVRRRLTAPAILVLEMHRPLNFVASQMLVMLEPLLTVAFKADEVQALIRILENRAGIERLILAIEDREAAAHHGIAAAGRTTDSGLRAPDSGLESST